MPLTSGEVIDRVEALRSLNATLRLEAQDSIASYGLRSIPKLPRDLARTAQVNILSPELIYATKAIRSFIMSFVTEITCLPTARDSSGYLSDPIKNKADDLEKAGAMWLASINPNRHLEQNGIWSQCVTPAAIFVLEMGAIGELDPFKRSPWRVFDADLDSCGWEEYNGCPTLFGRHYRQTMYRVQREFSRRQGTEYEGADLSFDDGVWTWKPAGDDYSPLMRRSTTGKGFQEAELQWYADEAQVAYVALNTPGAKFNVGPFRFGTSNQRSGQLVYQGPNPFGRCPAFIVPGNRTALRAAEDHFEAFLMELKVVTEQLNVLSTMRATASRNRASPRDYVAMDPDSYKEWLAKGGQALEWEDGKTPIVGGEIKERPINVDPDLDALEQRLEDRRARYMPANFDVLRQPDVLKGSTAAALLSAWDSASRYLSPMIGEFDVFRRELLECWERSIEYIAAEYGEEYATFGLIAGAGDYTRSKNLKAGAQLTITPQLFEVDHTWRVVTRSRDLGQAAAREQLVRERMTPLPDGRPGVGVYSDYFDAIDEPDPEQRKITMAKEALLADVMDPLARQQATEQFAAYVELEAGIRLPLGAVAPQAPAAPQSNGIAVHQTVSPSTAPTQGGSGPAQV